jgi:hypothetical protein
MGTDDIASSEILDIVGIAINASIIDAFKRLRPVSISKYFCKKGANTTIPTKPIITEGIDAIISIEGFIISRTPGDASSLRYTAIARLKGIAKTEAKRVTDNDAAIKGKTPNLGISLVGYHSVPNMKSFRLILPNIGMPSLKRNTIIRNNKNTQVRPIIIKLFSIMMSKTMLLIFFIYPIP